MSYIGSARVKTAPATDLEGNVIPGAFNPAHSFPATMKRTPHGLDPEPIGECMIDFTTAADIQATIEADPNVVTLYWYEEA